MPVYKRHLEKGDEEGEGEGGVERETDREIATSIIRQTSLMKPHRL